MLQTLLYRILLPFILVVLAIILLILEMQKITLAEFYGKNLSFEEYLNWFSVHPVNTVDVVKVLQARQPNNYGGTIQEWCPNIQSERGVISISYLANTPICCALGKGQRYVYYKENEQQLSVLCGRWPNTEIVTLNKTGHQSLSTHRH